MNPTKKLQRRKFLQQSAIASVAAVLPMSAFSISKKPTYKLGLQLFTIRDAMKKDPIVTLGKVREMGYEDTEIYGYQGELDRYYGMKSKDFKNLLDELQLTATSGHYNFSDYFDRSDSDLERYLDQCITGAHAIGSKYITWPWLAPEYRDIDNFKKLSEKLNHMGEQVIASGLGFAYHNHDFEFFDHNGQTGYGIILAETESELVKLQMDMYWIKHASKLSPSEWIAKNRGRYVMWHIKDMNKETRDYTELGNGSIDYVKILSQIDTDALEYYYLEQGGNFAQNSMQSIADSAEYFKKYLQKYL